MEDLAEWEEQEVEVVHKVPVALVVQAAVEEHLSFVQPEAPEVLEALLFGLFGQMPREQQRQQSQLQKIFSS
jgi:hypothetical protein